MKQVWHIYYGTKGTAGAYIDALLKASSIAGIDASAFVSCNYRFRFGKIFKCFFPITDFTENRNAFIILLRGMELAVSYLYILVLAIIRRPIVVCHLIDDLYATYLFFKLCKISGLTVRITCHDVSSHYQGMNNIRARILVQADELVVHNEAAALTICQNLGNSIRSKIKMYPFPLSAYDEIVSPQRMHTVKTRLRASIGTGYYLFLGVVRRSKGIESLVEAWPRFNKDKRERLVIAGKWTDPGEQIRTNAENDDTIAVLNRYLDDEEFLQLIRDAKIVVLPYLDYAHSSVIISCGNHGGAVVISDIELFNQFLPSYPYKFKHGDAEDLVRVLNKTVALSDAVIESRREELKAAVTIQNEHLVADLREAYRS